MVGMSIRGKVLIIKIKVIHLGIKPRRGGSPARDRRLRINRWVKGRFGSWDILERL